MARAPAIEPRALILALAGGLVLLILAAYTYGFKKDLKEFQRLRSITAHLDLEKDPAEEARVTARLAALGTEIEALRERLYGRGHALAPSQMIAFVIARLDSLSLSHDVGLTSVKPGNRSEVLGYVEVPFDVEVTGRYVDLFSWLQAAERDLRPMVVKQFRIRPGAEDGRLRMSLRVVSFRPPTGAS